MSFCLHLITSPQIHARTAHCFRLIQFTGAMHHPWPWRCSENILCLRCWMVGTIWFVHFVRSKWSGHLLSRVSLQCDWSELTDFGVGFHSFWRRYSFRTAEVVDATRQFNLCVDSVSLSTFSFSFSCIPSTNNNDTAAAKFQLKFRMNSLKLLHKVFGRNFTFCRIFSPPSSSSFVSF